MREWAKWVSEFGARPKARTGISMKSVKSSLYERLATQANNNNEYDYKMTALVKVKNEYLTK